MIPTRLGLGHIVNFGLTAIRTVTPDNLNEFRRPTLTSLSLLDTQGSGKSRRNNALQAFP